MDVQLIEVLVGAVLPPFIDVVNRYIDNSNIRYGVSLLVSLLIGVLLSYNRLSLTNVLESGAIVFTAAQTVYKTYYVNSKLQTKIRG